MNARLDFTASPACRHVLESIGRTEDLTFSPSGRRLAVAGFLTHRIVVFEIDLETDSRRIALTGLVELRGAALCGPHGLAFVDEHTLIVANRDGRLHVIAAPPHAGTDRDVTVEPLRTIDGSADAPVETPGSVSARRRPDGSVELLVCSNYSHRVTRHLVDPQRGYASVGDELLLARGLKVPDGVCVSADGRWIALSNHDTHSVLLYDRLAGAIGPQREPDGVLRDVMCPHGLRFTPDQAFLLVADASAPHLNVYARGADDWRGTRDPVMQFPVIGATDYRRGRHNPEEGGPKGIDIAPQAPVLATTCECQTLAFFDLAQVLDHRNAPLPRHRRRRYLRWRLELLLHRGVARVTGAAG